MILFLILRKRDGEKSRERILEYVRNHPGINKKRLSAAVDLSWTATAYHVSKLESQGLIQLQRLGRRGILCFPHGLSDQFKPWLATLHDKDAVIVLAAIQASPSIGVTEICKSTGFTESVVTRHLKQLESGGLIQKRGAVRPRYRCHPNLPAHFGYGHLDAPQYSP